MSTFGTANIGASRTQRAKMELGQLLPPTDKQLDYADTLVDALRTCGCGEAEDYAKQVREATSIGGMSDLIQVMIDELDGHDDISVEDSIWDGKDW